MISKAGQELTVTGFTFLVKSVEDAVHDYKPLNDDENIDVDDQSIEKAKLKSHLLRQNTTIAIITAMVIISLGKTHFGAFSGWAAHMIYGEGTHELISWCRKSRGNQFNSLQNRSTSVDDEDDENKA